MPYNPPPGSLRAPWDHPSYSAILQQQRSELERLRCGSLRDFLQRSRGANHHSNGSPGIPSQHLPPMEKMGRVTPLHEQPTSGTVLTIADLLHKEEDINTPIYHSRSLTESLHIVLKMLEQVEDSKHALHEEDIQLLQKIAKHIPSANAAGGGGGGKRSTSKTRSVDFNENSNPHSHEEDDAMQSSTMSRQLSVFRRTNVPREWMERFLDFSTCCATADLSKSDEILQTICDEIEILTRSEDVYIWVKIEDYLVCEEKKIVLPLLNTRSSTSKNNTGREVGLGEEAEQEKEVEARKGLWKPEDCIREAYYLQKPVQPEGNDPLMANNEPQPWQSALYFPAVAGENCFAVLEVLLPSNHDSELTPRTKKMAERDRTTLSTSIANVGALFLRNQRSYMELLAQHQKANAMLQMSELLAKDVLDEHVLVSTIMKTVRELTNADRCSVFLCEHERQKLRAYFENEKRFVTMSIHAGIAGHVANTGETVNIKDAYEDARFNKDVDKATGYHTNTILCMPVMYEGVIVAVAQLINKKSMTLIDMEFEKSFTEKDEDLFKTFSTMVGVCLRNCRVNSELQRTQKKTESMLKVAAKLAEMDIRDTDSIVTYIMAGAKELLNADRGSLFLVDKEHNCLQSKPEFNTGGVDIVVPSGKGIVGSVAETGKADNVEDAYADPRFNQEVDKVLNYKTTSMMTQPILRNGECIAVTQLINKFDPLTNEVTVFSKEDHETFGGFSLFAAVAMSNAQLLEFAIQAGKEAMNLEAMSRGGAHRKLSKTNIKMRANISEEEMVDVHAVELNSKWFEEAKTNQFDLYLLRREFQDRGPDAAASILVDLIMSTGLPEEFGCPKNVLARFIVACRKKYRLVPYHNFFHAVDVAQTIYTFLYQGQAKEFLTRVECFVLFIVGLVHDLDHMGVNNSFHLKTESPLGILSSATGNNSVLEIHHCNVAIELLQEAQQNVFGGIEDPTERANALRAMLDCVLATDMARHGDLAAQFEKKFLIPMMQQQQPENNDQIHKEDSMEELGFDKTNEAHRRLVMMLLTKAADISNITKPFHISKLWGMSVTEEFYRQGDAEKQKGLSVAPMFDRSLQTELAKGQLGFIKFLGQPFFSKFCQFFTNCHFCIENIEKNRAEWDRDLEMVAMSKNET